MCSFAAAELHPDYWGNAAKGFLSLDLHHRLVDEGPEHGLPAASYGFHCEPLQHPRIAEMISYARSKDVLDLRVGTNGHYLDKEMSRKLIDAALTRLEVSNDALGVNGACAVFDYYKEFPFDPRCFSGAMHFSAEGNRARADWISGELVPHLVSLQPASGCAHVKPRCVQEAARTP